jgi:protein involved in sex pheromone biosynthesis
MNTRFQNHAAAAAAAARSSFIIWARPLTCLCLMLLAGMMVGCQSMKPDSLVDKIVNPNREADEKHKEEENQHRMSYQESHNSEDAEWLLANCVHTGLTVKEINHIMGEEGVEEEFPKKYLTKDGHYLTSDNVYKWGPDSSGKTYVLVFREGLLVNYDFHQLTNKSDTGNPFE